MKTTLKLTFTTLATAAFLFLGTTNVNAQQKFGFINSQELISSMPESDSVQTKMTKLGEDLEAERTIMHAEYTNKVQAFQTGVNDMSETILKQKEKELNDLRARIESFEQDAKAEFQKTQQELFVPVVNKAQAAITKVAKEQNLAGVFDLSTGSLVYHDDSKMVDILPLVKKSLGITK